MVFINYLKKIMVKIFNTLTKKKEKFQTIKKNIVTLYVCGVTVYDVCHIGHARTFIFFDIFKKFLKFLGYKVFYVRNITDIDDKIINIAQKKNVSTNEIANRMIEEMHTDFKNLKISSPNLEPKVTSYIKEIINIIEILVKKKHAYIGKNGDIMFCIESYKKYGSLSRQNTQKLIKKYNINKKNSLDFTLWKISSKYPNWNSPWGKGRPGWHIECSTMSSTIFKNGFDIHGGGIDLVFPHHENEIAQSYCVSEKNCPKFWMHTGMVKVQNEKMSKSLNNSVSIKKILSSYDYESIRYFLSFSQYRKNIKFEEKYLIQARSSIRRLYNSLLGANLFLKPKWGENFIKKFIESMSDDFNTPKAYAVLFSISKEINKMKKTKNQKFHGLACTLKMLGKFFGILQQDPKIFLKKYKNFTNASDKKA
ncbi:cysteine--tRNA ligase [bacterium endosymbiont of Pedicinus badii]|uniref:cysteine--tRNA ligase n=1 Tax=bacterium endosymbiont of Pedicinus badii TaxID=1719126 RepID=UPI00117F2F9C|nr:cysteine--tRNA ligase [bacterium endosymbiont of Pedicinus badii]